MQFADLRTDVEMDADDVHMGQGLDPRGVLEHLLVRNAELAVGLSRVDAVVRAGVDVRVDTQRDVGHGARLRRERIHDLQLLDRLAVDRQNTLRDGVAQLLVTLAHAGRKRFPGSKPASTALRSSLPEAQSMPSPYSRMIASR